MHSLEAFHFNHTQLILVLPTNQIEYWKELVSQYRFDIPHQIVEGGETRFHSVRNGLAAIEANDGLVAIHDGVRPLVDRDIIDNSYQTAEHNGCAIVSVALKDSIRSVSTEGNRQEDRTAFRLIQTPQTFRLDLILKAFKQAYDPLFTDDASVFEKAGHKVHLIEGSYRNLKITTPEDLLTAESFLKA